MQNAPSATAGDQSQQELRLVDIVNFFVRYKRILLGVAIVAGVLSTIVAMSMPAVYTAKLKMIPPQILNNEMVQPVLKSDRVAETLVRQSNLVQSFQMASENEARGQLMKSTRIREKDGLIEIDVEDVDPKRALTIVNAYPEALDSVVMVLELTKNRVQIRKLESRARALQSTLDELNKELVVTERGHAAGLLEAQKIAAKNVAYLKAQLDFLLDAEIVVGKEQSGLDRVREQLTSQLLPAQFQIRAGLRSADRDYLEKFQQVKYLEALIELLRKRQALFQLEDQMNKVRVLDAGTLPGVQSGPKRLLIVVSSILAAISFAIMLLLFKEWREAFRKQSRSL